MGTTRPSAAWARRRPTTGYSALGLVLGVIFLAVPLVAPLVGVPVEFRRPERHLVLTTPDVVLTGLSALVLTQAGRRPGLSLVLVGAASLTAVLGGWSVNMTEPALGIALFAWAVHRPRRDTIVAATVTSVVLGLASVAAGVLRGSWGGETAVLWVWTAAALAIAAQSRRATMAALEARAREAEESREETALRRVAEDRVRIARELHDVIAHHVAVISVQSGVAEHLVERDPAAAREAVHHVRASARSVLTELQSVLGVLRQDENALPTAPTPGLSALDALVASFRSIGMSIDLRTSDPPPALTPAADVAASRLVQEALTNAHKHAPGTTVSIEVRDAGDAAEVVVTNAPVPPHPAGGPSAPRGEGLGLGLVGMRERVTAAGGSLVTGPTGDGGFRVTARLPRSPEVR